MWILVAAFMTCSTFLVLSACFAAGRAGRMEEGMEAFSG